MSCSPTTLLSDGKDFQRLSEREQLIAMAQLLCDIAQSGGAFAVVLANGSVYGPNGVVDTSATTTNGIQEAISSLPAGDLTSRFAGGGTIWLGKGVFSCSGQITIPNAGAFNLRMEGAGKVATILKYTGTATSFINTAADTVNGPPGSSSLNCSFKGIGFTHGGPATSATILLRLFALNEVDIDDCLFCPDAALANGGNCLNYTPGGSAVGTEGLRTSGCNMVRIRNSAFWICARGATLLSAHARAENSIFDGCKDANSNYSFSNDGTYSYPKSYGVACGATDFILRGCHFDGCTMPVFSAGFVQNCEPVFESCTYTSVVDGNAGGAIRVYNPNPIIDGGFAPTDKTVSVSGTVTASTDSSILNYVSSNSGGFPVDATLWQVIQGAVVRDVMPTVARVTSSDATTTGQTLVDITGLSVALAISAVYEFEAVLSVATTAVTTGTKYGVQYSVAGGAVEAQIIASSTATATESERISALNTATSAFLTTSGETGQALIKGIVTTGANAGNFTIQHLKVTSGTSTVKVNSFLKVRRIA